MFAWYSIWPALGRLCLASIFLFSGYGKITNWAQTTGYMTSKGLPFPDILLVGAAGTELIAGLLLVLGIRTRPAAIALILYLIPTTLLFHAFWDAEGAALRGETIQFLKNLAIIGGLLHIAAPAAPQPLFRRN